MTSLRNKLIHLSFVILSPLFSFQSPIRCSVAFSLPIHQHDNIRNKLSLAGTSSFFINPKSHRTMSLHQTSVIDDTTSPPPSSSIDRINELADEMNQLAKEEKPFTTHELDEIMASLSDILPPSPPNDDESSTVRPNLPAIRSLLQEVGHLPYTEWEKTANSASRLRALLLGEGKGGLTDEFRFMFDRVLTEGNWDAAATATGTSDASANDERPWAVLVTGLNGIRKSTSVYQPWFEELLREAIASPPREDIASSTTLEELPTGHNSFFRQLDHMIATLVNRHFCTLYVLTSQSPHFQDGDDDATASPPAELIAAYSNLKAAIFARYRTLSEILGILLVREAQSLRSNVMIETSGRSVGMFHYIDEFFPADEYRKLVLRFTIDDRGCAEDSVDKRMVKEMKNGIGVLEGGDGSKEDMVREMVRANLGGPYGSEVLKGVQEDSDRVWETKVVGDSLSPGEVGGDWYRACIEIRTNTEQDATDGGGVTKNKDEGWTANAISGNDGSQGKIYDFVPPRR